MRFLVDEALSWQVADRLKSAGDDALHVRDLGLRGKPDAVILETAREQDRTIVTQDTDFATIPAISNAIKPSVIRLRIRDGRPATHAAILLKNLESWANELAAGAIVVVSEDQARIRRLPIR